MLILSLNSNVIIIAAGGDKRNTASHALLNNKLRK